MQTAYKPEQRGRPRQREFTRLAVAHPQRHFTLRHNERPINDLRPVEHWSERIGILCGTEVAEQMI